MQEEDEDSMSNRQLKEETLYRDSFFDVVVYDEGKTGHLCPECGTLLTTVVCTCSCPYYNECEDRGIHEANGQAWCPVEKETRE